MFVNGNGRQFLDDKSTALSHNDIEHGPWSFVFSTHMLPKVHLEVLLWTHRVPQATHHCWGCGQTCYGGIATSWRGSQMSLVHQVFKHKFAFDNRIDVLTTMITETHQSDVVFVNGNKRRPSDDESTTSSQNDIKHGPLGPTLLTYVIYKISIHHCHMQSTSSHPSLSRLWSNTL